MKLKLTAAVLSALLLGGCTEREVTEQVSVTSAPYTMAEESTAVSRREKMLPTDFFNESAFLKHTEEAQVYESGGEMFTLPHHLTAGRLIASVMKTAAQNREKTETVVITATMHFGRDDFFVTSFSDWETPFGVLECDRQLTERIAEELGAVSDDKAAAEDHGIAALIPYVKYYFPHAQIAFVLVDNRAERDTAEKIAAVYDEFSAEKECVYLFSADFSHYLEPPQTDRCDKETLEAVLSMDHDRVAAMNDSNVDSPYVLGSFMRLAERKGEAITLYEHSNSMLMARIPYTKKAYPEGLTSYYVFGISGW